MNLLLQVDSDKLVKYLTCYLPLVTNKELKEQYLKMINQLNNSDFNSNMNYQSITSFEMDLYNINEIVQKSPSN